MHLKSLSESERHLREEFGFVCSQITSSDYQHKKNPYSSDLKKYLELDVTYPSDLVSDLYQFTVKFADAVKEQLPSKSSIDRFSTLPSVEKTANLWNMAKISYSGISKKANQIQHFPWMVFDSKEKGWGAYYHDEHLIRFSKDTETGPFEQLFATAVHELGHSFIASRVKEEKFHPKKGYGNYSTGLIWTWFNTHHKMPSYYRMCPEEAIVRQMSVLGTELISPNASISKKISTSEMSKSYRKSASSNQFMQHLIMDTKLQTESLAIQAIRLHSNLG